MLCDSMLLYKLSFVGPYFMTLATRYDIRPYKSVLYLLLTLHSHAIYVTESDKIRLMTLFDFSL